jgi:transposase
MLESMTRGSQKHKNLRQAGLLNEHPERVREGLFQDYPDFFDVHDLLQVRYEMLRSHLVDEREVVEVCASYGVSRQTYYTVQERFTLDGTSGLLLRRPGPRGPSKIKGEALAFIEQELSKVPRTSTVEIIETLRERLDIQVHRRTIEKIAWEYELKKNFKI